MAKKEITEKSEIARLTKIYKNLPPHKFQVVQGLIAEAARLRVMVDTLWKDIEEHGTVEMFSQSKDAEPYERERPQAKQYIAANKSYLAIIRQLSEIAPASVGKGKLDKLGLNG